MKLPLIINLTVIETKQEFCCSFIWRNRVKLSIGVGVWWKVKAAWLHMSPQLQKRNSWFPCRSRWCWIRVFVWDVAAWLYSRTHDRLLSASLNPSQICSRDVLVMLFRCYSGAQVVFDMKREPLCLFSHHAPSFLFVLKLTSPLISKMSSSGSVESGKPPKVSHFHRHQNTWNVCR